MDLPGLNMIRAVKRAWRRWIEVAEFLGNVRMAVFLSLLYFLIIPVIAVPFKLLSDRWRSGVPGVGSSATLLRVLWIR